MFGKVRNQSQIPFHSVQPRRLFHPHCASHLRDSLLLKPLTLDARQDISRRLRDTVIRSFEKCGIALPTSGQRDREISLRGLENYRLATRATLSRYGLMTMNKCNNNFGLYDETHEHFYGLLRFHCK